MNIIQYLKEFNKNYQLEQMRKEDQLHRVYLRKEREADHRELYYYVFGVERNEDEIYDQEITALVDLEEKLVRKSKWNYISWCELLDDEERDMEGCKTESERQEKVAAYARRKEEYNAIAQQEILELFKHDLYSKRSQDREKEGTKEITAWYFSHAARRLWMEEC